MLMMLRWTVPVERGNEAIKDGSPGRLSRCYRNSGRRRPISGPRTENAPG